eukprot:6182967-Pleurochrysis_carterae.AAC.2
MPSSRRASIGALASPLCVRSPLLFACKCPCNCLWEHERKSVCQPLCNRAGVRACNREYICARDLYVFAHARVHACMQLRVHACMPAHAHSCMQLRRIDLPDLQAQLLQWSSDGCVFIGHTLANDLRA